MNDGCEAQVERDFEDWLKRQGWAIAAKVEHVDLCARRADEVLVAEVKGHTSSPGLDVDTGYGQLLRRMTDDPSMRYAVVVPPSMRRSAERVPGWVRQQLRITVYLVDADGGVRSVPDGEVNSP